MNIERLQQVVRVLKELPKDKKFEMSAWGYCGTVACAAGWAGLDPWFRKRGFVTHKLSSGSLYVESSHGTRGGFDAIENFFGLSASVAQDIFNGRYARPTKANVIRHLNKYINKELKNANPKD